MKCLLDLRQGFFWSFPIWLSMLLWNDFLTLPQKWDAFLLNRGAVFEPHVVVGHFIIFSFNKFHSPKGPKWLKHLLRRCFGVVLRLKYLLRRCLDP